MVRHVDSVPTALVDPGGQASGNQVHCPLLLAHCGYRRPGGPGECSAVCLLPTVALGDERGVERAVVRHVDSHRVEVEYGCLSYCL